jgi:hypothetical protein
VEGGGGAYPLKAVGFALAEAFRKAVDSPGLRGPEQSERLLSRVLVLVASLGWVEPHVHLMLYN